MLVYSHWHHNITSRDIFRLAATLSRLLAGPRRLRCSLTSRIRTLFEGHLFPGMADVAMAHSSWSSRSTAVTGLAPASPWAAMHLSDMVTYGEWGECDLLAVAEVQDLNSGGCKRNFSGLQILVLRQAHKDFPTLGIVWMDGGVFGLLDIFHHVQCCQSLRRERFKDKEPSLFLFCPAPVYSVSVVKRNESNQDHLLVS